MLTVRTSENTVITSFRLITERQDFSSVRTGENTVRARARIHISCAANINSFIFVKGGTRKSVSQLMKSPPGVSANLKLPMREASSMPFSRSKDVSLLTALFSSAAFSCSLRSKRVLPQRSGNASEKQEKMSF